MAVGHYENFPVASLLLPAPLREPVEVIYRFARSADDFADEGDDPPEVRLQKLNDYRAQLAAPVDAAVPGRRKNHSGTWASGPAVRRPARRLLAGRDQEALRDFAEVLDYCRRSANPVGRLLLHLFKRTSDSDLRAVRRHLLGAAAHQPLAGRGHRLRARTTASTCRRTRWRASASPSAICADKICDPAWQALMKFQVDRARELMLSGAPLGHSPARPHRPRDPRHRAGRPAHPREDRARRLRRVPPPAGAQAARLAAAAAAEPRT